MRPPARARSSGCSAASTATCTATITQRLPTPGYDAFTRFRSTLGRRDVRLAVDNGFGLVDNPYHANLPYMDKQKALFGEASYKFDQFKLTAGGRWYDFHETRDFISGGLFSNDDKRIGDKTKSNGFSPRGIISWEPDRSLSVNIQAAKGFRLGGVNDPLNVPLCTAQTDDLRTVRPFSRPTRTRRCGTTKPASNIRSTASRSTPRPSTTTSRTCR